MGANQSLAGQGGSTSELLLHEGGECLRQVTSSLPGQCMVAKQGHPHPVRSEKTNESELHVFRWLKTEAEHAHSTQKETFDKSERASCCELAEQFPSCLTY